MKWSEVQRHQPRLGKLATEKLIDPGVLLIGTVRRDGSARISGVEPLIMDGDLWLSMMQRSVKALDLQHDSRIQLHSIVTGPEAATEVKVRGRAHQESDGKIHRRYADRAAAQLGWGPVVGEFALFAIGIEDLTSIGYDEETGAQHVARWPADVEYLRPAISPTKLGPRRTVRRILVDDETSAGQSS